MMTTLPVQKKLPIETNYLWRANLIRFTLPFLMLALVAILEAQSIGLKRVALSSNFFQKLRFLASSDRWPCSFPLPTLFRSLKS